MKVPKSVSKMLENKYVLYFVLFLAVTNILGYMVLGNITSIVFFVLIAYLVSNFSKNMIIILSVPLILTSVLMVGSKAVEGMTNPDTSSSTHTSSTTSTVTAHPTTKQPEPKKIPIIPLTPSEMSLPITPEYMDSPTTEASGNSAANDPQGMTTMYHKKNNRIDYAATVEDAYEDLGKILGGDGVKRLTDDTQRLMGQQMQLADAMKSMTPLLEQAKTMLQGFDLKNLDGLASMAKQLSGSSTTPQ
jgi:hypothetical protein